MPTIRFRNPAELGKKVLTPRVDNATIWANIRVPVGQAAEAAFTETPIIHESSDHFQNMRRRFIVLLVAGDGNSVVPHDVLLAI
jgi:hypothetical protein